MKGTPTAIREWLMSSQQGSHVSLSQSQESDLDQMIPGICGQQRLMSFAEYDHDTHCWRTSQACLVAGTWEEFSETWPRAGITVDGACYQQPKRERRISEIGSGLHWPTPSASDHKGAGKNGKPRDRLDYAVEMGKTKSKTYAAPAVGGRLSPTWVEWLMGWPLGWTDLKPLVMDKYQQWLEKHGIY